MRIKFVQDVNWLVFSAILAGTGGIVLQSIVANSLGIAALGLYALVIAIYNVIASGCAMGMDVIALRIAAVYRASSGSHTDNIRLELKHQVGSALILVTLASICVTAVSSVVLALWPSILDSHDIDRLFLYLLPTVIVSSMNKVLAAVLLGLRKALPFAMIRVVRIVLLVSVTSIAIQLDRNSVFLLLFAYPITEGILFIYLLMRFRRDNLLGFDLSHPLQKDHYNEGLIISVSTFLSEISKFLPLLVAGYFLPLEEIGEIAFIMAVSQAMLLFSASISNNVNPIIASRWSNGHRSELKAEMCKIYRVTIGSAPFLLVGSVLAYLVISNLAMPERFSELVYIFTAFSISSSLRHALDWPGFMLILIGKSTLNVVRLLCTVFLSLLMLSIASNYWGIGGLSIAVVLTATWQIMLLNVFVKSGAGIDLFDLAKCTLTAPDTLR